MTDKETKDFDELLMRVFQIPAKILSPEGETTGIMVFIKANTKDEKSFDRTYKTKLIGEIKVRMN